MDTKQLIHEALEARNMAWAPYSNFLVGAALLCANGKVYRGCNIENAAFGPGNCAERTAIFKAVSEGERDFVSIAVVGGPRENTGDLGFAYPCGVCRQVMLEFCKPDFEIIVAANQETYKRHTLAELLPKGFKAKELSGANTAK